MSPPPTSKRMQAYFVGAVWIMLAHKVECWITDEWQVSPFFEAVIALSISRGTNVSDAVGEAVFVTFIVWLFAGLVMVTLVLRGGYGPLLALGIWGVTFVVELHHLWRALNTSAYYPGLFTASVYATFGLLYWRALIAEYRSYKAELT